MSRPLVYIETFGCQMNELDSELVSGALRSLGYGFTSRADDAGVVLYNTCSVRDHAEQKVRSRLGEMALRKKERPGLVVGVLGCMAERDGADMLKRFPVVDVLCGPGELDKLPSMVDNAVRTVFRGGEEGVHREDGTHRGGAGGAEGDFVSGFGAHAGGRGAGAGGAAGRSRVSLRDIGASAVKSPAKQVALQGNASRRSATLAAAGDSLEMLDLSRSVAPDDHAGSAYVRITRGCNKFCTYCVVPSTRGAEVHRPPEHIVDECRMLADAGVIEVTLLGQTVNHYRFEHGAAVSVGGVVQPQKGRSYQGGHRRDPFAGERVTTFADLLREIHEKAPGIQRLRFVTSYPRDFGDDVLEVMRDSERVCRYLHVPAQTGSDAMLKAMNRGYTVGEYLEFIDRARAHLHQPEIGRPLTIAGDIIAGFCGETEEDHRATAALLERVRYKNCFIFKYSPRPGTSAFDRMVDDVPEEVKRRRVNELLALQSRISDELSRELIGLETSVFVQGLSARASKAKRRREKAAAGSGAGSGAAVLTINGVSAAGNGHDHADGACEGHDHGACAVDGDGRAVEFEADEAGPVQLSGRTEGDLIVVFDCPEGRRPESYIGTVQRVRVRSANLLTMSGELV